MISAILQVNILWFDKISDHNFFCKYYDLKNPGQKDFLDIDINNNNIAENFKMIVRDNQNFYVLYKPDYKQKKISNMFIKKILDNGKFVLEQDVQDDFFSKEIYNAICIYDYNFFINSHDFCSCYQTKNNNIARVNLFNKIFLYDSGEIIFFNSSLNKIYKYNLKQKFDLGDFINEVKAASNNIFLYDTKNNYFYPDQICNLNIINLYAENSELLMNTISKKLDNFFDNPATKNIENINNIFTFSNEFVLVKYLPNNILEYKNYKSQEKESSPALDYLAAINFIKNDPVIKNNFILKNYSHKDNRSEFYFDYYINNIDLELDKTFSQKNNVKNFICVTVKNNLVIKYKKITFSFEPDNNKINNRLNRFKKYIFDGDLLFQI